MSERAKVTTKTHEAKSGNSSSQTKKTNFSQSIGSPFDQIMFLQRTVGNRAVEGLLKSGVIQAKLKISEPGDIYEQEADRVAEQVLATPAHHAVSGAPPHIQRFSGRPTGQMAAAPDSVEQALASPGKTLEPALRQDMEQRFGHDFSHVRVHNDASAAESAREVRALAYTVGHNVVFGEDKYAPTTDAGRELLAHELAHTIQQRNASGAPAFADPDGAFETSASAAARNVVNGGVVSRDLPACGLQIQRAPDKDPRWKNDVKAARYRGQLMANRIRKHGKLSPEARTKIDSELAYFEGAAKEAYTREVRPALAAVVEIEMPAVEMRPEPAKPERTEQEREYEAMAAYYAGTRQSQLEEAAAVRAKFREGVYGMTRQQIYSQWKAGKEEFVAVASSPDHHLSKDQLLEIWLRHWSDRWEAGKAKVMEIHQREAAIDQAAFVRKMWRFYEDNDRDAFGPEYRKAAYDKTTGPLMFRYVNYAYEILIAREQSGKKLTLQQLDEEVIGFAGFREPFVQAAEAYGTVSRGGPRATAEKQPPLEGPPPTTPSMRPPAQTIKASPPPPPARPPGQTIKASPPPPPVAAPRLKGRGPTPVTDAEVVASNARDPSSIKPQDAHLHQTEWQKSGGGSETAPLAYRDPDGTIRVSTDSWLLAPARRVGIPPVSPGAAPPLPASPRVTPARQPATTPAKEDIGLADTGQVPAVSSATPDPLAKTPAAPAPAKPSPPAASVSPQAKTGAAAAESQRPQALRGQIDPPQAVSPEVVRNMRNRPKVVDPQRKGRGSNVGYTIDHDAHELAWRRLGGHGDSPPAFIYDGQVYLDPSRWPR